MGKVSIGKLKGHPIIAGDINLKNEHEIHISQLIKSADTPPPPIIGDSEYSVATEEEINDVCADIFNT